MSYDESSQGETDVESFDVPTHLSFRSDPQITDSSRAFESSAQFDSSESSSDQRRATLSGPTHEQASHGGHGYGPTNATSTTTPSASTSSTMTSGLVDSHSDQATPANLPEKASEKDLHSAKSANNEEDRDNSVVLDVVCDRPHLSEKESRGIESLNVVSIGLEANGEQYTARVRLCHFAETAPDLKLTDVWIDDHRAFRQTPRRAKRNPRYSHPTI